MSHSRWQRGRAGDPVPHLPPIGFKGIGKLHLFTDKGKLRIDKGLPARLPNIGGQGTSHDTGRYLNVIWRGMDGKRRAALPGRY